MEIENSDVVNQLQPDEYFLSTIQLIKDKKYFTQISLFSDYFKTLTIVMFERNNINSKFQINLQQIDEEHYKISIYTQQISSQKQNNTFQITILQMDRIIKILIRKIYINNKKSKLIDSFWFDHKSYLSPKVSNFYKVSNIIELRKSLNINLNKLSDVNIKQRKPSQLNHIFICRIRSAIITGQNKYIQDIMRPIIFLSVQKHNIGKQFNQVLSTSSNILLICAFLDIKSIVKLKILNNQIYKNYLYRQKFFFKRLYQFQYGFTGFDQNQLDFKKSFNQKRQQTKNSKNKSKLIIKKL